MKKEISSNNLGRIAVIAYQGKCYLAKVIDLIHETQTPKRMRIFSDLILQGMVVMPTEYSFKCWANEEDY